LPKVSHLGFGVYVFSPQFKVISHSYCLTNMRPIVAGECKVVCCICGKNCSKRSMVMKAGRIHTSSSVMKDGVDCEVLCGICTQLPNYISKNDFKSAFVSMGLDRYTSAPVFPAQPPAQAWCADPAQVNLLARNAMLHSVDGQFATYSFIGRSKDEALRRMMCKVFQVLWTVCGTTRSCDLISMSQLNQIRFAASILIFRKVQKGVFVGKNWGGFYSACPNVSRTYMDWNFKFTQSTIERVPLERYFEVLLLYLSGNLPDIVSCTQLLDSGFCISQTDLEERLNGACLMVDVLAALEDPTLDDVLTAGVGVVKI